MAASSWFRRVVLGFSDAPAGPRFSVGEESVPPSLFGWDSYESVISPAPRVSRREAIQVPAVKRGRDLIAGTIGTLPFEVVDTENVVTVSNLLAQPERSLARSITMTRLVEDLLFEGFAWWRVVERDYRGYPVKVVRLLPRSVQQRQDGRTYVNRRGESQGMAWEWVPDSDLIRFDASADGLLDAGARAIRTYLKLAVAADRYADDPMPSGALFPRDGADPDEDEMQAAADAWQAARQTRSTAMLNAAVDYKTFQWSPEQLQMSDARQHAVLEIARLLGIDAEDLGVSTTSRTYQNSQDRRLAMINDTLGMYVSAIVERLSMGDVTPRGYRVRADWNGFLRADDKTRYEVYGLQKALGVIDRRGIADREGLAEPTFPEPSPAPVSRETEEPMRASFDAPAGVFGFDTPEQRNAFEVDRESRTIYGLAVPYGVVAVNNGHRFQFSKGSLKWGDVSRVKLLMRHDRSAAVGKAIELEDTDSGLWAKFQVARGEEGDRALTLAEDGVWDGLSIGLKDGGKFERRAGVHHSVSNELAEISLTPSPAFDDARVSAVAAEADPQGGSPMGDQETTESSTETAPTFDVDAVVAALGERFELRPRQADAPEVITPAASLSVDEALPYRFDRGGNLVEGPQYDFSTDLFNGLGGADRHPDREAYDRVVSFMQAKFDVDTTDGAALNPSGQRPDLYVDQRQYRYPLYEATRAGTLTSKTPFVIPKFNTASGLVAAHTEGTEPAPGAFTATSATVTPGAVSGKIEITRELWDQGGNPNISGIIWRQIERAYYEALEAKVVAVLDAASPTAIALTAGGGTTGQTLSAELGQAIAALQYVRGGFAFDTFAVQIDLFKAIVGALDGDKRPLFPMLGATNANGTIERRAAAVDVYGVNGFPEWALAATGSVVASSYLFDSQSVRTWASAPQRLFWDFGATVQTDNIPQVAYVTMGVWGYSVAAILDTAGVREVTYDPVA